MSMGGSDGFFVDNSVGMCVVSLSIGYIDGTFKILDALWLWIAEVMMKRSTKYTRGQAKLLQKLLVILWGFLSDHSTLCFVFLFHWVRWGETWMVIFEGLVCLRKEIVMVVL